MRNIFANIALQTAVVLSVLVAMVWALLFFKNGADVDATTTALMGNLFMLIPFAIVVFAGFTRVAWKDITREWQKSAR